MKYTFEILGVSPVLDFFNHQQKFIQKRQSRGLEYLGTYHCTLDDFIESVETVSPKLGWKLDEVVDTVIQFWMHNSEGIRYWKRRLDDAGYENVLVSRVADIKSLQAEFDSLLGQTP